MNTKRKHSVITRLSDAEREAFCKKVEETGLSQQMYCLDALLTAKTTSKEELDRLEAISKQLADLTVIERGIGTNVNQIARYVNTEHVASFETIQEIQSAIRFAEKERERLWQSIRLLLRQLRHMQP